MLYYIIIHIIRYIYIYIYKYHMCIAPVYGKLQSTIQWKNAVFHDTTKKNKKTMLVSVFFRRNIEMGYT